MNIMCKSSWRRNNRERRSAGCRLIGGLLALILCLGCVACGIKLPTQPDEPMETVKIPTYDEKGNYTGFADIAEDSDPDKALARGCYVVDHSELYGGKEAWEDFLAKAEAGENAFLRVAHKIYPGEIDMDSTGGEGTMYYNDLYYYEGKYYYFCYNGADDIRADGPYTYLRELTGVSGNPAKERNMYVLTDSLELTYDDVEWSFLSSNLETVTKIRFQWLGFTIYMREESDSQ